MPARAMPEKNNVTSATILDSFIMESVEFGYVKPKKINERLWLSIGDRQTRGAETCDKKKKGSITFYLQTVVWRCDVSVLMSLLCILS